MTRLSVNINKVALLRNSRGADVPNLLTVALDCERFGAQGITVHPRPDERHVRRDDIPVLLHNIATEFNIEGYPSDDFIQLVLDNRPAQVTLVPDEPGQLTSDHGWDARKHGAWLRELADTFRSSGVRMSIFWTQISPKWLLLPTQAPIVSSFTPVLTRTPFGKTQKQPLPRIDRLD